MFKFKIITLISILFTLFVVARPASAQLYDLGLKGGLNLSTFSDSDNTEYHTGFLFGAFINIQPPLSPVGIQPEVLYTRLGSDYVTDFETLFEEEEIRESLSIDYVQFPVLLKYYLPVPGPVDPHLNAGPYFGIKANAEYPSEWDDEPGDFEESISDQDYGVVFGVGTDLRLMVATFQLDARYTYGLQNVFEDENGNGQKHRAFSLSLGLAF